MQHLSELYGGQTLQNLSGMEILLRDDCFSFWADSRLPR
jgi:hypothetical protein